MDTENVVCPVCTLYLRPGITLKSHLTSHPKQKVIEALVRLSEREQKDDTTEQPETRWNQTNLSTIPTNFGNHSFIYQHFMSTSSPQPNVNQYVTIPTVFNSQMMCPPYVYQQQHVIMSSGPNVQSVLPRPLPIELPDSAANMVTISDISETEPSKSEKDLEIHTEKEEEVECSKEADEQTDLVDENFGSPHSNVSSDWSVKVKSLKDLSKACQTISTPSHFSPASSPEPSPVNPPPQQPPKEFYYSLTPIETSTDNFEVQNAPIYTVTSNENFVDVDRMQLLLPNDFQDLEDRPQILMTLGSVENSREVFTEYIHDQSVSHESAIVSIRADERMPARGELSGPESNASDLTWSRVQYDGNSELSAPYELIPRDEWEVSDYSDSEQANGVKAGDLPTVVSYTAPPMNFKCGSCDEAFKTLHERQEHVKVCHDKSNTLIGSNIGKKKVKKLVVKPKREIKSENNFDNVFTNKLKLETASEPPNTIEPQPLSIAIENDPLKLDTVLICSLCDSVHASRKMLQLHKLEAHQITSETRNKCGTCDEVFPNEYKYTEHLRVHPLECRICAKYFYRRQNMQLHMKRHLGIRPYKCDVCDKAFLTKQKHDEHRNIHTGDAPIKCNLCDESFRRYSNLVQHRNLHHLNVKKKIKDFICVCGEVFHSKKKLAWHKEIHDSKPKACIHCSEKFIHMASLTRHMRRAHNERFVPKEGRNNENVECPICKGVFIRSSLNAHIRNHSGQRPYTCLLCNKDFTTKWNLKFHKWTHASRTSKPFRCDQCKGAFIRETEYVAHMNSHKSVKPYTCNYCGAQFIRKCNRQRHVREHEKTKNFSCQVCGKSFHRSYYLKDHMRIHSDLRPYSCHICGKTSRTKSNHNKHVRIHHAREPVSTEN